MTRVVMVEWEVRDTKPGAAPCPGIYQTAGMVRDQDISVERIMFHPTHRIDHEWGPIGKPTVIRWELIKEAFFCDTGEAIEQPKEETADLDQMQEYVEEDAKEEPCESSES